MNTTDVAQYLNEQLKKKADAYDFSIVESDSTDLEIFESEIKKSEISSSYAVGIRLFKNGKPGYSSAKRFTLESLDIMINDALSHADLTDKVEIELPSSLNESKLDLQAYNPELENVTMNEMKDFCLVIEEKVKSGNKIENIPYLGMGKSSGTKHFYNSKGVHYNNRSNSISAYVGASAQDGDVKKMGVYSNGSRSLNKLDHQLFSNKVIERAEELLEAKPIPSGEYPVVFSNRVSGSLISMFGSIFSADMVQKGQSKLKGKLNQKIASEKLSILCNPLLVGEPGSRLYDGEGINCKETPIITDGKLINVIHNLETAKKDNVVASGHGVRGLNSRAGVSFSNLIVEKGEQALNSMLNSVNQCLYIVKLDGSSACSAISGEISIGVQGFLIENGERVQAVDRVILNSNIFDLFNKIQCFSNEYSDAFSSIKVPDMLVDKISLSS
jgi:PmbA protein